MHPDLLTLAETSGFTQTGRTDEVDRLCTLFAATWPAAVRTLEFGRSVEGRPLQALIVSRSGDLSARELKRRGVPILLIQGGIHPGESDGKDAGFIVLRELLSQTGPGVLDHLALVFVPAFNADGHERVRRWNRPNQNGPEITGSRATAQNLNLNRDYTKADAPEMQAMLALIGGWDPLICADLHVTDGADFEPDISIQVEPLNQGDALLRPSGVKLRDGLLAKLAANGSLPLPFYPDLFETDNPASGFLLTVYSPRFSTGYFPQRNRFTVLVETHSWKPYAQRISAMRTTVLGLCELAAAHGTAWLAQTRAADEAACTLGGTRLTLDYRSGWREPTAAGQVLPTASGAARLIEFRGYAYTRERSALSGQLATTYDPTTPQLWHVPYRDTVEPSLVTRAPRVGYFIPQAYAQSMGERLERHGIRCSALPLGASHPALEEFNSTQVTFSSRPFEGRTRATIEGEWLPLDQDNKLSDGDRVPVLLVPIDQPLARLIVALLEPQAPDSFAAWGFFNARFEEKEELEPYVAEGIARELYATNPALRAEFEQRLHSDAAFEADATARLAFFCRHHPSWDAHASAYPIWRA